MGNRYAAALALAALAMPASGAVILEVSSVFAGQGSSGNTIEVDVENTGGASIVIGGFNFEIIADADIDFTGAGFATSETYIFAGDSFDQNYSLPLDTSTGSTFSAGDISNSGEGDTLGAGQTAGLALVTFDVSPGATLGSAAISFSSDPSDTNLSDQNGDDINIDSLVGGSIDVTASTPEPSSLPLLLAAVLGLGVWRLVADAFRRRALDQS